MHLSLHMKKLKIWGLFLELIHDLRHGINLNARNDKKMIKMWIKI